MNSDKLNYIIKKKSNGNNNITHHLHQMFFFECVLRRIEVSKYKNNIILKGGVLLSSIIGEDLRTTKDIDTTLKSVPLNKTNIQNIFNEILAIDINDNVLFKIENIKDIRDEDEYGGFRVSMIVNYDEMHEPIHIDIATGDPITPREIRYKYLPLLGDYYIDLYAYNMETVLAEKIETILSRLELNGRAKDFYDIYLIYTKEWKNINLDHFRKAIDKTFTKREYNGNSSEALDIIKNSEALKERWNKYQKNFDYAEGIEFEDIMDCLEIMIEQLESVGI